jgi:hypothetical protein
MTYDSAIVETADLAAYLNTNAAAGISNVIVVKWNIDSVLVIIGTP